MSSRYAKSLWLTEHDKLQGHYQILYSEKVNLVTPEENQLVDRLIGRVPFDILLLILEFTLDEVELEFDKNGQISSWYIDSDEIISTLFGMMKREKKLFLYRRNIRAPIHVTNDDIQVNLRDLYLLKYLQKNHNVQVKIVLTVDVNEVTDELKKFFDELENVHMLIIRCNLSLVNQLLRTTWCRSVRDVRLVGNVLRTDDLSVLSQYLQNVQNIHFDYCKWFAKLSDVNCPNLKRLELSGYQITREDLETLNKTKLKQLYGDFSFSSECIGVMNHTIVQIQYHEHITKHNLDIMCMVLENFTALQIFENPMV
jgi:hypothetical protein